MIAYHGSPNKNLVNLNINNYKTHGGSHGNGIYLASDKSDADVYKGPSGKTYTVEMPDSLKFLYSEDLLTSDMKSYILQEIDKNKDLKNYLLTFCPKVYTNDNKEEAYEFFLNKKKEWEQKDNIFFENIPSTKLLGNTYKITYRDYDNINIDNITNDQLYKAIYYCFGVETFADIVTSFGYDGYKEKRGTDYWYIVYKNVDKLKILENKSNIQEAYISLIESEVFPNSKIDSIVYHGTNNQFDEFDITHRTNNGKMYGQGIYFTIDEDQAQKYTRNGTILKGYINIENPFYIGYQETLEYAIRRENPYEVADIYSKNTIDPKKVTTYLISRGYDGINIEDKMFVIFNKDQFSKVD